MGKKNYGKSVKTRLLNLMNETGYKYMYLLARYFNERLLYRVSVSQYKDNFLLKNKNSLYIHIRTCNEFLVIYIGSFDTPSTHPQKHIFKSKTTNL